MSHFLLTIEERSGESIFHTKHLVKTPDRQMVKYLYHKSLRDIGYTGTSIGDKHTLEMWDNGCMAEIHSIEGLTADEYESMKPYLRLL